MTKTIKNQIVKSLKLLFIWCAMNEADGASVEFNTPVGKVKAQVSFSEAEEDE